MNRILLSLLAISFSVSIAYSQIDYANENYNIVIGDKIEDKSGEVIRFVAADYIITVSQFNRASKIKSIARYNREDFSNEWRVEIPKEIEYQKLDLVPDTCFFGDDGTCNIIAKGYDKKTDKVKFYHLSYDADGKKSGLRFIGNMPLKDDKEFRCRYILSKEHLVIVGISDFTDKSDIQLSAIWADTSYEQVGTISMEAFDKSSNFESVLYDEANHNLFVIMKMPFRSINGIPLKRDSFMYKLGLDDKSTEKTELVFEDFKLYSNSLFKNEVNGDIMISAFAGEKNSTNMSANALLHVNPKDLSIGGTKFFPIAAASVEKLKESKRFSEKMFTASNSASFNFRGSYFLEDGSFYLVYENTQGMYHSGVYLLHFDKKNQLTWEDYIGNSGYGLSKIKLEYGEMKITSWVASKFMNTLFPEVDVFQDNTMYNQAIMQFTIDRKSTRYEIFCNINSKGQQYYWYFLDEPKVVDGTESIFANICFGNAVTLEKRVLAEIKRK